VLPDPTPPDATRLTDKHVWDEARRPTGPPPDPDRSYRPHEAEAPRHLVEIHDHFRSELAAIRDVVEQVHAGELDPGDARSHVNAMTLRQNRWNVGAYCASYCRALTMHHTVEDRGVFPNLRRADPRLGPVLDRLELEHHAIHEVLEGVDRALVALIAEPDSVQQLRDAVDLLSDVLRSHLSYEERELIEPLARIGLY
jgi:hypothetical protein